MPERTVETYDHGHHVVTLVEETEENTGQIIRYQARCRCGWTGGAKYYQPARQSGLAHVRESDAP